MTGTNPYGCVLVGTDGSLTASRAVQRAADLARRVGARLVVAYVGDATLGRSVVDGMVTLHGQDLEIEPRLLTGDPADALLGLAKAEDVDLIVVGSKGMAGAQRFLLGSVPNKISHQSSTDVLIVHTTD